MVIKMIATITVNPSVDRLYKINILQPNKLNRVKILKHMVGGKGFNAARVASLLGKDTYAFGFVGGNNGDFIRNEAKQDTYKTCFIDTGIETRNCIQIIDKNENKTEINEEGLPIPHIFYEQLEENVKHILEKENINSISLNGSLPQGINYEFYLKLMKIIKKENPNCKIILDTAGSIIKEILDSDIMPDIIKPNEHEIADYLNISVTTDPQKLMEEIRINKNLSRIPIIFVSLGAKGCLVKAHENYYYALHKPVKAINTEGSGDAMVGGILASFDENSNNIEKVIRYGCAAGTANAMNLKTGYLDPQIFNKVKQNIQIKQIN